MRNLLAGLNDINGSPVREGTELEFYDSDCKDIFILLWSEEDYAYRIYSKHNKTHPAFDAKLARMMQVVTRQKLVSG